MINSILNLIELPPRDFIYTLIKEPGLCVDVGAGYGEITRKLRLSGTANTQVIAFEPFPKNHEYFINHTKDLNNIKLIQKAVSNKIGKDLFYVPSSVQGTETGWENFPGYSSVGFMANYFTKIKILAKSILHKTPNTIQVSTTTLDAEFPNENIDFLKMDIQGGELKALKGAINILKNHRVKIIYLEFTGDKKIVNILERFGYIVYDSTYIGCPRNNDVSIFEKNGFNIIESVNLSTGKTAYSMLLSRELDPCKVLTRINKDKLGWVQTDLIAVKSEMLDQFKKFF